MLKVGIFMMLAAGMLAVAGAVCGRKYVSGPAAAGYLGYVLRKSVLKKCGLSEKQERCFRELYVNREPEEKEIRELSKESAVLLLILFGFGGGIAAFSVTGAFSPAEVTELRRPVSGTEAQALLADYRDETLELSVEVSERELTEEEIDEVLSRVREELPDRILGENESLAEVSHDLTLPTAFAGLPVTISWYSSDYRVVSFDGTVAPKEATGEAVTLTARLSCGGRTEELAIPVTVVREEAEAEASGDRILAALSEAEKTQAGQETVSLPSSVEGESIRFYTEGEEKPAILFLLLGLLLILVPAVCSERRKKQSEERKCQLLTDYPEVVSKLTLLLEAGLTIRGAWERILSDYENYIRKSGRRYAYEEMLRTRSSLLVGVPEEQAYEDYGRSCGLVIYLRFSQILVQNLRKGTGSIIPLLEKEAEEARFSRKEQARQLGEEAGTKLLLPMGGMLVIVLVIVLVPAFMAF